MTLQRENFGESNNRDKDMLSLGLVLPEKRIPERSSGSSNQGYYFSSCVVLYMVGIFSDGGKFRAG